MHCTVIHSLVNPPYSLKRLCVGGERVDFLHFNNKETGPERWSDLSKVTQLLRGGDKLRLSRAAWLRGGGEEGSAEGDNRGG